MKKKFLVVGAGITGLTLAERLSSIDSEIFIVDKRKQVGGNCYDYVDKAGIVVHKYGPHLFHTDSLNVWQYLSQFTKWTPYNHRVLGYFNDTYSPIPFNLTSLHALLPSRADYLEKKLFDKYSKGERISILDLMNSDEKSLKKLADFIYKNIFFNYSKKQWGLIPTQLDPLVLSRVPIVLSHDNNYFSDQYQAMPENGYTEIFNKMIEGKNIKLSLNTKLSQINNISKFDAIFYTGKIDEFFRYKYGILDYRCFKLTFKTLKRKNFQPSPVVNYTEKEPKYTRITEFNKITGPSKNQTTICYEYPGKNGVPGWPLLDSKNKKKLRKYKKEINKLNNIFFIGRLAEFKYLDMDDAVSNALTLFSKLLYENKL